MDPNPELDPDLYKKYPVPGGPKNRRIRLWIQNTEKYSRLLLFLPYILAQETVIYCCFLVWVFRSSRIPPFLCHLDRNRIMIRLQLGSLQQQIKVFDIFCQFLSPVFCRRFLQSPGPDTKKLGSIHQHWFFQFGSFIPLPFPSVSSQHGYG
jgi:hypothetical protein